MSQSFSAVFFHQNNSQMVSSFLLLGLIFIAEINLRACFHISHAIRHARWKISMNRRNETVPVERRSQSFLSPAFANEIENTDGSDLKYWTEQAGSSNSIIPTGPESLARIEQKVNDHVNMKILNSARTAEAAKYFKMVESLAPNEMLTKFAKTAPRPVQEAAKSTIMNLLGNLPNYALDAALITTNTKLANLLYQMQMTGYMFKNAEYRMSLTRMLKGLPRLPPPSTLLTADNFTLSLPLNAGTTVLGEVTLRSPSGDMNVSVEQLTSALSNEIAALRSELLQVRTVRENELRANLLTYIQALPEPELVKLTAGMSEDVVLAIQMLVDALMDRLGIPHTNSSNSNSESIGDSGIGSNNNRGSNRGSYSSPSANTGNSANSGSNGATSGGRGEEVVVQQSVGQLAQLCMWQMVVGYKLRELEVLEKGASLD